MASMLNTLALVLFGLCVAAVMVYSFFSRRLLNHLETTDFEAFKEALPYSGVFYNSTKTLRFCFTPDAPGSDPVVTRLKARMRLAFWVEMVFLIFFLAVCIIGVWVV
jgi:hypothetical protein